MESDVPTLAGNDTPGPDQLPPSYSLRSASDLDTTVAGEDLDSALDRAAGDPLRVGRHEVNGRLGAGGMGVVYSAYDPELDRRLAIKVIRPTSGGGSSQSSRGRLMREAQAMARVSHPNVITVYDVGTIDERIYIAMELIEGSTLGQWTRNEDEAGQAHRRPWKEIVEVYCRAAEGLIAAHEAQLVHRDFKPQNVLVGHDGAPRVLDFGLARASNLPDVGASSNPTHPDAPSVNSQLDSKLTRTGAMIGTPAYMSPEQIEGRPADARSDQFSFCVSLWEALYDERPFAGRTMAELSYAVLEGQLQSPKGERARAVPEYLRVALERGLSAKADERFDDMRQLVDALRSDPRVQRKRRLLFGAAVVTVALGGAALARLIAGPDAAQACRDGASRLSEQWEQGGRASVEAAYASSELELADLIRKRTLDELGDYAKAWGDAYTQACDATHEGQSQSIESLELRLACLNRRALSFRSGVELLGRSDGGGIAAADHLLDALPPLEGCADLEQLRIGAGPTPDPAIVGELEDARAALARVKAQITAGELTLAREALAALNKTQLGERYTPFAAELALVAGQLADASGDYASAERELKESYWKATELRRDDLVAEAASALVSVVGESRARAEDGLDWFRNADAVYSRMRRSSPPSLERRRVAVLAARGDYVNALELARALTQMQGQLSDGELAASLELQLELETTLAQFELAAQTRERLDTLVSTNFGPEHPRALTAMQAGAELQMAQGNWDAAMKAHRNALKLAERLYGPNHPVAARSLGELSELLRRKEKFTAAREEAQFALERAEASVGPEHPLTGEMAHRLGLAYIAEDNLPAAHTLMERARDIAARAYGEQSVEFALPLQGLGTIAEKRKDWDGAEALYQRALGIEERELGRDHPRSASLHTKLGNLDFWRTDYHAAADHYFRTLAIKEKTLGPDHPTIPLAIMHAAGSYDYTGDLDRAGELHAKALEAFKRIHGPDYHYVATASLNLSRVRERQGRFEESLELTREAQRVWMLDHDPEHFEMAYVYTLLGRAYVGLGREGEAIEPLEHALRIREDLGETLLQRDTVLADTRFALGRALYESQPRKARRLIDAAEKGYAAAGPYAAYERGEVERWKAAH